MTAARQTLDVFTSYSNWRRDWRRFRCRYQTILGVPRLLVAKLLNQRVLPRIIFDEKYQSRVPLRSTIENPSNALPLLGITMEPSEKFAFSGVSNRALQLVLYRGNQMRFRLLLVWRGEWIGPIHLRDSG